MFKFIQQYAEKIDNVAVYPIVSLFIFLVFFVALIYFVVRMDKKSVQLLSNIPLDNTGDENNQPF
jgi:heme/copper-type cytochrome/quinol oxidase subunit 2